MRERKQAERRTAGAAAIARKSGEQASGGPGALRRRLGNAGTQQLMRTVSGDSETVPSGALATRRVAPSGEPAGASDRPGAADSAGSRGLASQRLRGDQRLERILAGEQAQFLRFGAAGDAVAKVQQTLMELGFPLPRAGADGRFGGETGGAVSRFKLQNGIAPADPVVGSKTIAALDAQSVQRPPAPAPACAEGTVSMEAEPLPPIPLPTVTRMPAGDLFKLVKARQGPGGQVPRAPPLGATMPRLENLKPVGVRVEPDATSSCVKCIADWVLPQPTVDIFIATGDFSDEPKRSFPVQEQSVSHCPVAGGGTFKEVIKRILPEAEPIILTAELEHWSDFVQTYLLITGRYLSNVRRLTPARTHLRGSNLADCVNQVNAFLFETTTFPVPLALPFYGALAGNAVSEVFFGTTKKREGDHSASPVPPMSKKPVFPNLDTAVNPFGCNAFFRKFDRTLAPGIPGPAFGTLIEDKEGAIPGKRPWNTL